MPLQIYKPRIDGSSSSTSTGARARTREEELQLLADCYADTFARRAPTMILDEMAEALDQGIEPCVIMMAMDETARAARPSWAYTMAILGACIREGCLSADAWRDRQARWRGRRRPTPALEYNQRSYAAEDRKSRFVDLEKE